MNIEDGWQRYRKAVWKAVSKPGVLHPFGVLILALLSLCVLLLGNARPDVITGFVAIATLAVTQSFELARRRSEERRWYAERFLTDKINALKQLYSVLNDWYRAANHYGNIPPSTLQEFRASLGAKEDPFLQALSFAQLYLDTDDDHAIREVMSALRRANIAIYHSLPDSEFPDGRPRVEQFMIMVPWLDLVASHRNATARLADLLNPRVPRQIETELRARVG